MLNTTLSRNKSLSYKGLINTIFLVFWFSFNTFSQDVVSIDYLLSLPTKETAIYDTNGLYKNCELIPFDFANGDAQQSIIWDSILSGSNPIIKIDFVYTRFKVSEEFDQQKLNRKRLELLRKNAPEIFDNNVIEWNFYEQVNTFDLATNKTLYHGFVIHFLNNEHYSGNKGIKSTEEEIDYIKKFLSETEKASSERVVGSITTGGGNYLPISKRKRAKGIRYDKKFIIWRKKEPETFDTIWVDKAIAAIFSTPIADSVVIKTLRKYDDEWGALIVVEDVTGSMYPYIAQTLAWKKLKTDSTDLQHFVFFNDGDNHPDGPIGKSGGAYYVHSNDINEIGKEVYAAMHKGYGGGAPENNIEALLFAEKEYKECPSYILIADNNAPIRDIELLKEVIKPTHIIICGVTNGRIHHSYISLAMKTAGSLHTIEEDIDKVPIIRAGETFKMGGQKFKLMGDGKLILVE